MSGYGICLLRRHGLEACLPAPCAMLHCPSRVPAECQFERGRGWGRVHIACRLGVN